MRRWLAAALLLLYPSAVFGQSYVYSSAAEKTLESMISPAGKLVKLPVTGLSTAPSLSLSGQGVIYYDPSATCFKASASGGAYSCITTAASGAPLNATYITQTPNASLTNEQALSTLATGILKNTTTTGVLSIAVAGTDYGNLSGTLTTDRIPRATGANTLGDTTVSWTADTLTLGVGSSNPQVISAAGLPLTFDNGTAIGIGLTNPTTLIQPSGFPRLVLSDPNNTTQDIVIATGDQDNDPAAGSGIILYTYTGNDPADPQPLSNGRTVGHIAFASPASSDSTPTVWAQIYAQYRSSPETADLIIDNSSNTISLFADGTAGWVTSEGLSFDLGAGIASDAFSFYMPSGAQAHIKSLSATSTYFAAGPIDGTGTLNLGVSATPEAVITSGAVAINGTLGTVGSQNTLTMAGSAIGAATTLTATGGDTNVSIQLMPKGSGMTLLRNITSEGTTPTVGNIGADSCGTTAATIVGTDNAGKFTVGATAGTACRVTFATAKTNAPACTCSNETTANLARPTSTTTRLDCAGTFVAGDVVAYTCIGY